MGCDLYMEETKNVASSEKINWSVVTVVIIGTFMAILDGSIVNVALPKMMAVFAVSEDSIQWVLTAYMLTLGAVMPLSGFLGDTFGYKRIYFFALALFVIGSAFCGINAVTPFAMITFWLTIRGAGMGLSMMPINVAAMNSVPKHLAGKASALMNVIRQISASFGIAMFTTIMQSRGSFHFSNMAQSVNMRTDIYNSMQAALRHLASTLSISPQALGISLVSKQLVILSMIKAIDDCFIIASCMCPAALFLCFFIKEA